MPKLDTCDQCGVPLLVGALRWGDNGVITQVSGAGHRMLFCESDNIDDLFARIGNIRGVPVDDIVIESMARDSRANVEDTLSPLARKAGRLVGSNIMVRRLSRTGRAFGYGDVSLVSRGKEADGSEAITMSVRNPHSILLFCGESLGAWEAIQGCENRVIREQVGDSEHHVTNVAGDHCVKLPEVRRRSAQARKPGDIALERCGTCGVPTLIGECAWDLEEGTIRNPEGGRMAMVGPAGLEAIFKDLAAELGVAIPGIVIEAQRRRVRETMGGRSGPGLSSTYREILAARGSGNLTSFDGNRDRLAVTIENSCLALLTVGMLQALFEMGAGHMASSCDYELAPDGDLEVRIKAL
ncbi:MAG: hypothetical protein ACYC99_13695 [Candidatus Geothermincolia bacterium]